MTAHPDPIVTVETWLAAQAVDRAPQRLLDETRVRVRATRQRRGRPGPWTQPAMARARAVTAVAGVVVLAVLALDFGLAGSGIIGPSGTPHPTATSTPRTTPLPAAPSAPALTQAVEGLIARALPGPRGGRAGLYAWIPDEPAWMHNPGDGPGVEMFFTPLESRRDTTQTQVIVGGHLASYEEHAKAAGGMTRLWVVGIGDTTVAIRIESSADTVDSDVAEALAIVASIRVVPDRNSVGFMLVLTVPGGWDSG